MSAHPHHTDSAAYIHRFGVAPDWDHERPEYVATWRIELDGSPLVQAMHKRLDEFKAERGESDATGERLLELLIELEQHATPLQDACTDWLHEVGAPMADDWDQYEFNNDHDWKGARW